MQENDFYANERMREQFGQVETVGRYTARAFLWMFAGLLVTFLVAMAGYVTGAIIFVFMIPYFHIILLVAELVVVLVLSARIQKLSVGGARALFFTYAALNGVVFSAYFLLFDMVSLVMVFGATALYFGVMAIFGYCTRMDLSRIRNILVGGLIFLIVVGVITLFIPNMEMLERIVCLIGIAVFLGFTAYDTQKIKAYHAAYAGNPEMAKKASIFSALQLYLDFINLFLYLLRFLGRRRS